MVQFLSINFFFLRFHQFLLGFSKVPLFFVSPVLSHTHKTRLHFGLMYFQLEYTRYWSQTRGGGLTLAQAASKVDCTLLGQYSTLSYSSSILLMYCRIVV